MRIIGLLLTVMTSQAFATSYDTIGTIDQYNSNFSRAAKSPVDLIELLKTTVYLHSHDLQIQSEFSFSNMNDFVNTLEELQDQLERIDFSESEANNAISQYSSTLSDLGNAEPIEFHSKVYFPYFPIRFRYGSHHISTFLEIEGGAAFDFLSAPIHFDVDSNSLKTQSSGRLNTYTHTLFGVDYANNLLHHKNYSLDAGVRLSGHYVGLYQELRAIDADREEDLEKLILDDYDNIVENAFDVSADIAIRFTDKESILTVGVRNINEPTFAYNSISSYCRSAEYMSERDCETANYFVGINRIKDTQKVKLYRQAYVQASHKTPIDNVRLSGYIEANKTKNLLNEWNQIARGEISYYNPNTWVTNAFIAIEKNVTGDKESRIIAGLSFFNRLRLIGYSSTSTIEEDRYNSPEDFGFSISINTKF